MDNPAKIVPGVIFYDDDEAFANPLFTADLVLSESHSVEVTATRNPVERGVDITDHLRAEPAALTAEVFLTGSPLVSESDRLNFAAIYLNESNGGAESANTKREWEEMLSGTYAALESLAKGTGPRGASLFKVATSIKVYKSMALVKVGLNRQSSTELSAKITLGFSEVVLAGLATVPARVSPVPGATKNKAKTQAARQSQPEQTGGTATAKNSNESWLNAGVEGRANGLEVVAGSVKGLFGL